MFIFEFGLDMYVYCDGNKYECRLLSNWYQHNLQKSFESWQLVSKPHGENFDNTFPVHFLYIPLILQASSPVLGYILIDVGQSYS
jgi:hypothetical protein